MGHDQHKPESHTSVPSAGTIFVIMGTLADTTWRMFTPVLSLLILGIWLDHRSNHKPLFSLGGVILGFVIAVALVALQYKDIKKSEDKANNKES